MKLPSAVITLLACAIAIIAFWAGAAWQRFDYLDKCTSSGGGANPGNHPICLIEKKIQNPVSK